MPALLTSTSISPSSRRQCSTTVSPAPVALTSTATALARTPSPVSASSVPPSAPSARSTRSTEGDDPLTHLLVGHADHRDVEHVGMGDDDVLDLARVDIDAPGDHEVGAAVGDVEIAVVVEPAVVAERAPALLVVGRRRLGRIVVVLEGAAAGEVDHPDLARRQVAALGSDDVDVAPGRLADAAAMGQPLGRRDERLTGA